MMKRHAIPRTRPAMIPGCDNGEGAVEPARVVAVVLVAIALVVVSVKIEEMVLEGLVGRGVGFMPTAPIDTRYSNTSGGRSRIHLGGSPSSESKRNDVNAGPPQTNAVCSSPGTAVESTLAIDGGALIEITAVQAELESC